MGVVAVEHVIAARMRSLLLSDRQHRTPLDVAQWFGAMQAQDAASGHWSLGLRSLETTEPDVVGAFARGDLIRTWPMRGTLHIIPGADASWFLALTGVRAMAGSERRKAQLGLTSKDVQIACATLSQALAGRQLITRSDALTIIEDAGVRTEGQRGYHLLLHAALTGITCVGPQQGTAQTFALLADWAPAQVQLSREDGLAELLLRYVRSHGPVSLRDFVGWTGLTMTAARAAAKANDGNLVPVATDVGELWATNECVDSMREFSAVDRRVLALPGFDEYMLGYKDRTLHVPTGGMERVVPGGNGVFRATVVVDGVTTATWTRTLRTTTVDVEVHEMSPMTDQDLAQMHTSFEEYAQFVGRELRLRKNAT